LDVLSFKADVQRWIISITGDPIAKILAKSSNLTKTQVETLLIDVLAEKITAKKVLYREKAKLRLLKTGVSRGAFNRTLRQAKENIIKAMYTVILLGYLGILESPQLQPYMELANKLQTYRETYTSIVKDGEISEEHKRIITVLQQELEEGLGKLADPRSISTRA
jgi:hypothetical protein